MLLDNRKEQQCLWIRVTPNIYLQNTQCGLWWNKEAAVSCVHTEGRFSPGGGIAAGHFIVRRWREVA